MSDLTLYSKPERHIWQHCLYHVALCRFTLVCDGWYGWGKMSRSDWLIPPSCFIQAAFRCCWKYEHLILNSLKKDQLNAINTVKSPYYLSVNLSISLHQTSIYENYITKQLLLHNV